MQRVRTQAGSFRGMNHGRLKRCRKKWAQCGPQQLLARIIGHKCNCKKKFKRGRIREVTNECS